jgi:hypothetical protein
MANSRHRSRWTAASRERLNARDKFERGLRTNVLGSRRPSNEPFRGAHRSDANVSLSPCTAWHPSEEEAMHDKVPPSVNIEHKLPANPDESKLNVVQAMKLCVSRINAVNATVEDEALYLSWLFHLVGDVHQPLHGVALFSRKTSRGRSGGNSLKTTTGQKLHGAWDGTLGPGSSLAYTAKRAHQYLKDQELRAAGESAAEVQLFKAWVEESYKAAIEAVYTAEILIVLQQNEQKTKPVEPTIPTNSECFDRARKTARTRAVEASYRLAEMIRAQLKL